jgi:hypothetical protein
LGTVLCERGRGWLGQATTHHQRRVNQSIGPIVYCILLVNERRTRCSTRCSRAAASSGAGQLQLMRALMTVGFPFRCPFGTGGGCRLSDTAAFDRVRGWCRSIRTHGDYPSRHAAQSIWMNPGDRLLSCLGDQSVAHHHVRHPFGELQDVVSDPICCRINGTKPSFTRRASSSTEPRLTLYFLMLVNMFLPVDRRTGPTLFSARLIAGLHCSAGRIRLWWARAKSMTARHHMPRAEPGSPIRPTNQTPSR